MTRPRAARHEFWTRRRRERLRRQDPAGYDAELREDPALDAAEPDEIRMARPIVAALGDESIARGARDREQAIANRPLAEVPPAPIPAFGDVVWTDDDRLTPPGPRDRGSTLQDLPQTARGRPRVSTRRPPERAARSRRGGSQAGARPATLAARARSQMGSRAAPRQERLSRHARWSHACSSAAILSAGTRAKSQDRGGSEADWARIACEGNPR